jgi:hypothetical protein
VTRIQFGFRKSAEPEIQVRTCRHVTVTVTAGVTVAVLLVAGGFGPRVYDDCQAASAELDDKEQWASLPVNLKFSHGVSGPGT